MTALSSILRELAGLFVDDGALAMMALVWVACVAWALPLALGPAACAVLLFLGLLAALTVGVLRA